MTRLIILLLALVVGLIAGPYFIGEKGYVLFAMDNWTVEMSVVSFGITMLLAFILFLFTEWLVKRLWRGFDGSFTWFSGWSQRRRNKAFLQGMAALEEQHYSEANKLLSKVPADDYSGLALLALAKTAVHQQNVPQAIAFWQQAQQQPATQIAATLHLARHEIHNKQPKQALTYLASLNEQAQLHPNVVQLTAEALAASGQWQTLHQRLPQWKKTLPKTLYQQWMAQASQGVLAEIASKQGANALKQHWQQLPRSVRKDPAQQAAYIQQLILQDMHSDAMQTLVDFQSQPEPILLPLFKQLRCNNPAPAVKKIEGWLKKDDNNLNLLSILAHIAFHAKDYTLCEKVMTKRLHLSNDKEDQILMAQTKEALGQPQAALSLYKAALKSPPR